MQEAENMEVHPHSHSHGKKNWKSYVWEFLMLFLAVFCGFLAEYQLEHTIEHNREKEFILSMIEDVQTDTSTVRNEIEQNKKQLRFIDSLATFCFNYDITKKTDYDIYRLYRRVLSSSAAVKPTERTLVQLKNSGGMRLLRKKAAVDMIILYDGSGKEVLFRQEISGIMNKECINVAFELMNFNYYNPGTYRGISQSAELLSHDRVKLIHFGNRITTYGASLTVYGQCLQRMNDDGIKLISTLRKEYHLMDK